MPPLAHSLLAGSLLAITALLVAINGKVIDLNEPPGSICHGVKIVVIDMSFTHQMVVSFDFESRGDEEIHEIVDHCTQVGLKIADETVRACNGFKQPSGPNSFPPDLRALGNETASKVFASCKGNPECKPIKFHVNQTCI